MSPRRSIRLGEEILGTSDGQGNKILASLSGTNLGFQYLGSISPSVQGSARTFTVSEQ